MKVEEGDVVLAPFGYSETPEKKLRPCLVLSVNPLWVVLVRITSKKLDKAFEHEVVLSDEESKMIGLTTRSKIDFRKRDSIPQAEVRRVVGNIGRLPRRRLAECFLAAKAAGIID